MNCIVWKGLHGKIMGLVEETGFHQKSCKTKVVEKNFKIKKNGKILILFFAHEIRER